MRSQSGNIALFLCLVLLIAALGGAYWTFSSGSPEAQRDFHGGFEKLKARVTTVLEDTRVLNASVERNPNPFACLYTATADCGRSGGAFLLYEGTGPGSRALSQLRQDNGVSLEGAGCRGFPSPLCPFRVEAEWKPVCGNAGPCENTRSARIVARVVLNDGKSTEEWSQEAMITPELKISEAVRCERDGGVWGLTECLTHEQAAERRLASSGQRVQTDPRVIEKVEATAAEVEPPRVVCEPEITIQGEIYPVQYITYNRAQVSVPAMNGCPAEDAFTFQCQPKGAEDRYGQWVQIEAQMAPSCDEQGRPIMNDRPAEGIRQ